MLNNGFVVQGLGFILFLILEIDILEGIGDFLAEGMNFK